MKLRDRLARLAPHSWIARRLGLCTDPFHSADDSDDFYAEYADQPHRIGPDLIVQGYHCPTCGFKTVRSSPRWQEPWWRLKDWLAKRNHPDHEPMT